MTMNALRQGLTVHGMQRIGMVLQVVERRIWLKLAIIRVLGNIFRQDERFLRLRCAGFRDRLSIGVNGMWRIDAVKRRHLVIGRDHCKDTQDDDKSCEESHFHVGSSPVIGI